MHVKTPKGDLLWPSDTALAVQMGVAAGHSGLSRHVSRLKKDHIRTIAKLDVFADHRLAETMPSLSVMDASTDSPWTDANGLHWSNPSDRRVWAYNIALSRELARMGFDEIQFDYIRFPATAIFLSSATPTPGPVFRNQTASRPFWKKRTMN